MKPNRAHAITIRIGPSMVCCREKTRHNTEGYTYERTKRDMLASSEK